MHINELRYGLYISSWDVQFWYLQYGMARATCDCTNYADFIFVLILLKGLSGHQTLWVHMSFIPLMVLIRFTKDSINQKFVLDDLGLDSVIMMLLSFSVSLYLFESKEAHMAKYSSISILGLYYSSSSFLFEECINTPDWKNAKIWSYFTASS